jgi:cold shock CspA family protein/ribosome-associated translation inhibitor RaiA
MQGTVHVSFDGIPVSAAIEASCLEEMTKLEHFHPGLTNGRVVISRPDRHRHKGNLFRVHIEAHVPGAVIAVTREPAEHASSEDVHLAVREAFDTARRQLEDHLRRQRGDIKVHASPPRGRVVKLMHESGYGFIESAAGEEIYFHRNSVLGGGFESLQLGSEVRFVPEQGEKGLQAASVRPLRRRVRAAP